MNRKTCKPMDGPPGDLLDPGCVVLPALSTIQSRSPTRMSVDLPWWRSKGCGAMETSVTHALLSLGLRGPRTNSTLQEVIGS